MSTESEGIGVVICCTHSPNAIRSSLQTLLESAAPKVGVLIVDRTATCSRAALDPRAEILEVPPETSLPSMRLLGTRYFDDIHVLWLGDYVVPTERWMPTACNSLEEGYGLVGGPVLNGLSGPAFHEAWYIAEYHDFCPPLTTGPEQSVAGCNVAINKSVVREIQSLPLDDRWDFLLFSELRRSGVRTLRHPDMTVRLQTEIAFPEGLFQRFYFSRSIAAQLRRSNPALNLLLAASRLLLPALLSWKLCRATRQKLTVPWWHLGPFLALISLVWAAGEAVGYLTGAGRSMSRIK